MNRTIGLGYLTGAQFSGTPRAKHPFSAYFWTHEQQKTHPNPITLRVSRVHCPSIRGRDGYYWVVQSMSEPSPRQRPRARVYDNNKHSLEYFYPQIMCYSWHLTLYLACTSLCTIWTVNIKAFWTVQCKRRWSRNIKRWDQSKSVLFVVKNEVKNEKLSLTPGLKNLTPRLNFCWAR